MSKIRCENLWFRYSSTEDYLFRDFSCEFSMNGITVMMGESGSGKTTLGLLLAGALQPERGQIYLGVKSYDELDEKPGYLHQNPDNHIIGPSVERDVAYGLENKAIPRDQMHAIVNRSLESFDLEAMKDRLTIHLSGGEKQRTALAGFLATDHPYIILDEPTSFLDYPGQQRLYDTLQTLLELEIGVLWISQYPEETIISDRTFELATEGIIPLNVENGLALSSKKTKADNRKSSSNLDNYENVLSGEGIRFKFPQNSSFRISCQHYEIKPGEVQGWYGYSGSGKSTFAKLLAGIHTDYSGSIEREISTEKIIYVSQFAENFLYSGDLNHIIEFLGHRPDFNKKVFEIEFRIQLSQMGLSLEEWQQRPVWKYSMGEQRQLIIALAISLQPEILILDEPTIGISPTDRNKIIRVLSEDFSYSIICISHEYQLLKAYCHRGVYFQNGSVDSPAEWEVLEDSYNFLQRSVFEEIASAEINH